MSKDRFSNVRGGRYVLKEIALLKDFFLIKHAFINVFYFRY